MRLRRRRTPWAIRALESWWPWALLSALLYLSGNRQARRAALRGLLASGASSFLMHGGRRARQKDALAPSAPGAAGAFGAAIALEMREAAPPTALASAGAVAASVRSGFHDGNAAVAGTALGAGLALASTRFWPVRPKHESQAPKVWLPSYAEPSEEGEGMVVVVNKASGNGDTPTNELKSALPAANVIEVDPESGEDLRKTFDSHADSAVALGVAGGDGSINTAAQIALDEEKALAIFPGGTFNHLTGALGVDCIEDAVTAVRKGQAVGVDVATIDGKVFLNTASFGGYVEFVDAREKLEERIGKWPAVIVALVRVLRSYEPIEVTIDDKAVKVWMAFIGNCRYHPAGFAPSWRERLDDELLDLRYVDGTAPWARLRLIMAVLTGRLGASKIYHQTCVDKVTLKSNNGPLRLARDGETFEGSEEILVEKLPKRLAVFVPHENQP